MSERQVIWVGDSKKNLMEFPKDVKVSIGYALSEAQKGRNAGYAVKLGDDLYVLHAFKKEVQIRDKDPEI